MTNKIKIAVIVIALLSGFTAKISLADSANGHPIVAAYWAGWSNAPIPSTKIDHLMLSFALMKKNKKDEFYSDYTASGQFQKPTSQGSYHIWKQWIKAHSKSGAKAYVSYGGSTNLAFRSFVIHSNHLELTQMAENIQQNVEKYHFGGVDLDIENWWNCSHDENKQFAKKLVFLVEKLRQTLDSHRSTKGDPISIVVNWNAAGPIDGISDYGSTYTGTMLSFFKNHSAMKTVSAINVMLYNTRSQNLYSKLPLVSSVLEAFAQAGIPKKKIMLGIQPYESSGDQASDYATITSLGKLVKEKGYGGMFMWGIGASSLGKLSAKNYIAAMEKGLWSHQQMLATKKIK